MVTEFPSLQGVMGREYARREGYSEDVCLAIYEHYLPIRAGGELPTSQVGAVVGCADRMDTIAGCFAVGLEPTGSADPFALRRHALAILRIFEQMEWDVPVREFIEKALSILDEKLTFDREGVFATLFEFFRERYKQMMIRSGYESDLIEAVISAAFDRIHQMRPRMDQLRRFASESREFEPLVLTSKRVTNILKNEKRSFEVDPTLFAETCEFALWEKYRTLEGAVRGCLEKGEFHGALNLLVGLIQPVSDLFDGVEILTKTDPALRENRLGLLQHLAALFLSLADFSKFPI
jgi:glycyl-tRNA synthetase beta chain